MSPYYALSKEHIGMHWGVRLIISLLAGMCAGVAGIGAVALFFLMTGIDPGIGGGLIALLVGVLSFIGAAIKTMGGFRTMGNPDQH